MVWSRTKYKSKILGKVRVVGSEYEWKDQTLIGKDTFIFLKKKEYRKNMGTETERCVDLIR